MAITNAKIQDFARAYRAAKKDAAEHGYGRGCSGKGSIPCPICKTGRLAYQVASLNGHMHAACTTKGCVSWME